MPPKHLPNDLFAQAFTTDGACTVYGAEYAIGGNFSRRCPGIYRDFHPGWPWRANASVLADQIGNAPAVVALLDVRERERRNFGSPQAAAEEDGENGAIA